MSSVTSIQRSPRQIERRGNFRCRPSSIIYAHMGSENGGIVVNLGMGGVAFQAAMKVIAPANSPLNLRLRGSGLNVEIPGELVWLGPTQKEVGVCFKSLSAEAQQQITEWIARETGQAEPEPVRPKPKPLPALAELPSAGSPSPISARNVTSAASPVSATTPTSPTTPISENPARHSLSAALAMSQSSAGASSSVPAANAGKPSRPVPLSSVSPSVASQTPFVAPVAEIPAANPKAAVSTDASTPRPNTKEPVPDAELAALLTQLLTVQTALSHPNPLESPAKSAPAPEQTHQQAREQILEQMPGHTPEQTFDRRLDQSAQRGAGKSPPAIPRITNQPAAHEKFSAALQRAQERNEIRTGPPVAPAVHYRVLQVLDRWFHSAVAERWIPPALVDAWKRGNSRQKLILAGSTAGCLLAFVLVLVLAAVGGGGPSKPSAEEQSPAQNAPASAPREPVAVHVDPVAPATGPQPAAAQTAPQAAAPHPSASPRPPQPQPSSVGSFFGNLFGVESEDSPKLDDSQVGVQVWTSQATGYYYCTNSGYYRSVQPGSFMAQGEALQKGYRPRLGQFCD